MQKRFRKKLEALSKAARENNNETKIEISGNVLYCTTECMGYISLTFFLLLIFVPPVYLLIEKANWINIVFSTIWLVIFSHKLLDFIKSEIKLIVNISRKSLKAENISLFQNKYKLPGRFSKNFVEKIIPFSRIKEIKLQSTNRYRYFSEETRIHAITIDNKKILLTEFKDQFIAKRFVFLLREILAGQLS